MQTKEQFDSFLEDYNQDLRRQLKLARKLERKETAEKFALEIADYFCGTCGGRLSIILTLQEWYKMIDEIVKELTGNREELTEG